MQQAIYLILGALISGFVGLWFDNIKSRRYAINAFRVTLSEFVLTAKTGDFYLKSCDSMSLALSRLRPFVNPKIFTDCERILEEYKGIPKAEMNQQSQKSLIYTLGHNTSIDERFLSFVKKFEKALA